MGPALQGWWTDTSSVYGPVALAAFWLSSVAGGLSARAVVWLLQVVALLSFAAVALLLDRAVGRTEGGGSGPARARVALLWTLNPLILFELVNAAHVDGLAVALGLLALLPARRSAVGAGLAAAAAAGVTLTLGLYALSVAWALRRQRSRLAVYLTAGAATGLAMYLPFWPGFLRPLQAASDYVSSGSVWHPVGVVLGYVAGPTTTRVVTSVGAVVLLVAVVRRLDLGLPSARGTTPSPGSRCSCCRRQVSTWCSSRGWRPLPTCPGWGPFLARRASSGRCSTASSRPPCRWLWWSSSSRQARVCGYRRRPARRSDPTDRAPRLNWWTHARGPRLDRGPLACVEVR